MALEGWYELFSYSWDRSGTHASSGHGVDLCFLGIHKEDSSVCNWDTVVPLGCSIVSHFRTWRGKRNRSDGEQPYEDSDQYGCSTEGKDEERRDMLAGKKPWSRTGMPSIFRAPKKWGGLKYGITVPSTLFGTQHGQVAAKASVIAHLQGPLVHSNGKLRLL
ncbi:hypothetical protein BDN67DRAFT_971229 [Paxillus ammoniavirescens]|nr:hypothetical protein BDN67DRAFT_971229 [Paxillus ammoniavirescens]